MKSKPRKDSKGLKASTIAVKNVLQFSFLQPMVLLRFLKCMHFDKEQTKSLIELNYSIRNKNPNLFIDRNMEDELTAKGLSVSDAVILPGITLEGNTLLLLRMTDYDPRTRNSVEESKIFLMVADARFTMPDVEKSETELASGTLYPSDNAEGDEAYPSRLRALHVINCPSFLDHMMAMMRPFMRDEVRKMTKYHTEGLESLYEDVPQDMLPDEYGGKAGTMPEIKEKWIRVLKKKGAYLRDETYWRIQSQGRSRWSWL